MIEHRNQEASSKRFFCFYAHTWRVVSSGIVPLMPEKNHLSIGVLCVERTNHESRSAIVCVPNTRILRRQIPRIAGDFKGWMNRVAAWQARVVI